MICVQGGRRRVLGRGRGEVCRGAAGAKKFHTKQPNKQLHNHGPHLQKCQSAYEKTTRVYPDHGEDNRKRHDRKGDVRHDLRSEKTIFIMHVVRVELHAVNAVVPFVLWQQELVVQFCARGRIGSGRA